MSWQAVETIPIAIGVSVSGARAHALRDALLRRAVPLSRLEQGRLEPLATGTLIARGEELGILTAGHVLEHANAGDLAIPLPGRERGARLNAGAHRVLVDPQRDLALILLGDRALARLLRSHWTPVALDDIGAAPKGKGVYGLAGYPVGQARRHDGCLYAKPVVLLTTAVSDGCYAYARTALRVDGCEIHTPELDGVSGAMIWSVDPLEPDPACRLRAVAVQVAFRHGHYLRAEAVGTTGHLFPQA